MKCNKNCYNSYNCNNDWIKDCQGLRPLRRFYHPSKGEYPSFIDTVNMHINDSDPKGKLDSYVMEGYCDITGKWRSKSGVQLSESQKVESWTHLTGKEAELYERC